MTKLLTLEDVGIPNISPREYYALPLLDRISTMLKISDEGFTLDSPINDDYAQHLIDRIHGDSFGGRYHSPSVGPLRELFRGDFTLRKFSSVLHDIATKHGSLLDEKRFMIHFFGMTMENPYWTNNFHGRFTENQNFPEVYRALQELTEGQDILSQERNEEGALFSPREPWTRDKLIYPYYITLKRRGFSGQDLAG